MRERFRVLAALGLALGSGACGGGGGSDWGSPATVLVFGGR